MMMMMTWVDASMLESVHRLPTPCSRISILSEWTLAQLPTWLLGHRSAYVRRPTMYNLLHARRPAGLINTSRQSQWRLQPRPDWVIAMALCLSVSLSVCLSQVGVLSKRLSGSSSFLARRVHSTNPTLCYHTFQASTPCSEKKRNVLFWT